MHIVEVDNRLWFHQHPDGFFDQVWNTDPRQITGEIVEGWICDGDGFFWKRRDMEISTFLEVPRRSISNSRYAKEELSKYIEYEKEYSVLEWFAKFPNEFRKDIEKAILKKARIEYVHAGNRLNNKEKIKELMEMHRDSQVSLDDALDLGYCKPGISRFIDQYKIQLNNDSCTVGTLLDHSSLDEMLKNSAFRSIMIGALL